MTQCELKFYEKEVTVHISVALKKTAYSTGGGGGGMIVFKN